MNALYQLFLSYHMDDEEKGMGVLYQQKILIKEGES